MSSAAAMVGNGPSGITIDADDNLYVVDQNNNRVQKFTAEGEYIMQWGEAGSGPGQFNLPWGWLWTRQATFTWPIGATTASRSSPPTASSWLALRVRGGRRPIASALQRVVDPEGYLHRRLGQRAGAGSGSRRQLSVKARGQATLSKWAADFLNVNPDEKRTREMSNPIPELPPHINTPYTTSPPRPSPISGTSVGKTG